MVQFSKLLSIVAYIDLEIGRKKDFFDKINSDNESVILEPQKERKIEVYKTKVLLVSKQLSKTAGLDSKNWLDESEEDCFDKINTDNESVILELQKERKIEVYKTKVLPVSKQLSEITGLDSKNWSDKSEEDCFDKIRSCFEQKDRQSKVIKWQNSSKFNDCSEGENEKSQIRKKHDR